MLPMELTCCGRCGWLWADGPDCPCGHADPAAAETLTMPSMTDIEGDVLRQVRDRARQRAETTDWVLAIEALLAADQDVVGDVALALEAISLDHPAGSREREAFRWFAVAALSVYGRPQ